MPITYNGIGTRYSGHRNAIARGGHCKSCKRLATLTSYDTTLFFVVLFIPIVPLGKKRILDECSKCRRHFVVPLQVYVDARAKDFAEADRLMANATADRDAIAALQLVNSYREVTEIHRLIDLAESKFPDSADLYLFAAETRRFLSEYQAAEASTARSLALREDPAVRENLAILQFARGDVDAGRATLEPLFVSPAVQPAAGVGAGVEALQSLGRHREAMELMSRLPIDGAPESIVKRFAALRATSEKTLERSLVDPERFEIEGDGAIVRRKRVRYAKLKWAAAIAAALAIAYGGYAFFLGVSRRAFLVNGTERPYTATIDGHAYALLPHEVRPIRVGEGDIAMSVAAPGYLGHPSTFHFATSPWTRPFNFDVLVLDPDGTAGIFTSTVVYTSGNGGGRPPETLYTGSIGHVFPNIDYPFEEPPKTVTLSSETDTIRKALAYLDRSPVARLVDHLNETHDARARIVATRALEWPVLDASEVAVSLEAIGVNEGIAALKPRVALRPLELESHRAYQDLVQARGDSASLEREYRAALDADPANGSLMYLVGRTLDGDSDAALAAFRNALAAHPSEPMGSVGEAYILTARGDFEGALAAIRRAKLTMPTRESVVDTEWELLIATHRYGEASKALAGDAATQSGGDFCRRVEALLAIDANANLDDMLAQRLAALTKRWDAKDAALDARVSRATIAYLRHQEATFGGLCTSDDLPGLRFAAAISKRDLATAEAEIAKQPAVSESSVLSLYLAADAAGQADVAKRWLQRSIDALRVGRAPLPRAAAWLAGDVAPSEADLTDWCAAPSDKAILFAAIAAARPELARRCRPFAERFNFSGFYPHELIAASLARPR